MRIFLPLALFAASALTFTAAAEDPQQAITAVPDATATSDTPVDPAAVPEVLATPAGKLIYISTISSPNQLPSSIHNLVFCSICSYACLPLPASTNIPPLKAVVDPSLHIGGH
jgi:hypothetical protein